MPIDKNVTLPKETASSKKDKSNSSNEEGPAFPKPPPKSIGGFYSGIATVGRKFCESIL